VKLNYNKFKHSLFPPILPKPPTSHIQRTKIRLNQATFSTFFPKDFHLQAMNSPLFLFFQDKKTKINQLTTQLKVIYLRKIYKQFKTNFQMEKKPFKAMLNKQLVTKEGKKLGTVKDITFEARTGELIHIVIKDLTTYTSNLSLERTPEREALIPYNSVIAVGDFIVVSEEDLI